MIRADTEFHVAGRKCAAWLYLPDGDGPHPCVVVAHGIGAIRQVRLSVYAERFTRAGMAVLTFDYRNWGESEGVPRHHCDIRSQHVDINAAIDHAKRLPQIDETRVALFGTSFGGGHAVVVGSQRSDLAGVVAQCAIVDCLAAAVHTPTGLALRWIGAGLIDTARAILGLSSRYMKLAGEPGQLALMSAPGAEAAYLAMIEQPAPWVNRIAARFVLTLPLYRPIRYARRIAPPLLMLVCGRDEICPASRVRKTARLAPKGRAVEFDAGHFDIYFGDHLDRALVEMIGFFREIGLGGTAQSQPETGEAA